jgi:hypothetical protein
MKKLLILTLAALMVLPVFSQLKFGLKLGANTATVPTYKISSGTNNIETLKDAQWGLQAGAFLRIGLKSIYIQPEIMLASNSYDYTVTTVTGPDVLHQKFTRLEIPVLLGIKLGPLHFNAGPSANINIGSPKALIDDSDFVDLYRSATFGYQAGIGLDLFNRLVIDARYGGSLSERFGDAVTIGTQTFNLDSRQPSFILSLGIMF